MEKQLTTYAKKRTDSSGNRSEVQSLIYGKVPPKATDLEEVVLGALMLESSAFDRVVDLITAESFYLNAHQVIFRAIKSLTNRHSPVEIMTVAEQLTKDGKLEEVGGVYYLTKLTNHVVSAANIEAHCAIIQQKYIRRELIRVSGEIINSAYDETTDDFEVLENSEKSIMEIGTRHVSGGMITMDDALVKAVAKIEEWRKMDSTLTGVPSGFQRLDRATRGWQPEDLIILAARPSVGKTAFALNLIRNAAMNEIKPVPVAVWSLEMSVVSLVLRMLAAESEVWLHKIQTGRLGDHEMHTIYHKGIQQLSKAKIFFDDTSSVTITSLRSKARRLKKKENIGLIVIDYLQLMSGDSKGNREQEISNISRSLKNLAKELQIPIIALSQLSRDIEKRTGANKRPQLSDLRESGAIEQDADLVMFLWGPTEEEVAQDSSLHGKRYVRIAKQRNGTLITEELDFKNEIQLFSAIDEIARPSSWKPIQLDMPPRNFSEPAKDDDLPF